MKLTTDPFEQISTGRKVIESRLYDDKRMQISIGDEIVFSENDNSSMSVTTRVKGLIRYQSFKDMFNDHDPALFGGKTRESLLKQIHDFYTDEDEQRYGVIGIRIELLD